MQAIMVEVEAVKRDHRVIVDMIEEGSSVLDLGCGDGDLLYNLVKIKKIKAKYEYPYWNRRSRQI